MAAAERRRSRAGVDINRVSASLDETIGWLDEALEAPRPVPDILERTPDLGLDDAYRVQQGVIARRAARGDSVIGYKAALTSRAMQREAGIDEPILGTLLASRLHDEDRQIRLGGYLRATLEPEVCVVLGRALSGPGVTRAQALACIAGYLPCIEVGDLRGASTTPSAAHTAACNTFNGGHVFGQPLCAPHGIDLRVEGMVLELNGEPRASATAIEVMGDPINVVVFIANKLGELGCTLDAGMALMTGSIVSSIEVRAGDAAEVRFTRLGRVRARFAE